MEMTPYEWKTLRKRSFPSIEANLEWQYIALHEAHLQLQTDTIPQTNYDDYDDNSDNDYLRA